MHDLSASDEVELGDRHDPVAVERWLEAEVEALERLRRHQACRGKGDADATALAEGELLREQALDRLEGADLWSASIRVRLVRQSG